MRQCPDPHQWRRQTTLSRDGPVAERSDREQSSSIPKKGAGDFAVPANEIASEICVSADLDLEPLQLGTPPRRRGNIQGLPLGRLGWVAVARQPGPQPHGFTVPSTERFASD
jgi:hypothetical protein